MLLDRDRYNMVLVLIDRFGKRSITLLCKKTIIAAETAELYIEHVYRIFGPPNTIVSDRGP